MPAGLQIYGPSGELRFDSTTAKGGVFIDSAVFGPGSSGVLSFPDYAGATPIILEQSRTQYASGITTSTSSGYPVVSVASTSETRVFAVILK